MAKHPKDTRPFHFKQFSLFHHRSTMKVGTDAILLAAWADVENTETILDVGSGSGIISMLLAARCDAQIQAIEIDRASVEEAAENFSQSKYKQRLHVQQKEFTSHAENCKHRYDMIVSNPPFFTNYTHKPKEEARKNARHVDRLNFEALCAGVAKLLNPQGKFCLVLPVSEKQTFIGIAARFDLFLQKQLSIFPKKDQEANRLNLQFGFQKPKEIDREDYVIRENDRTFTSQHIHFLKDYYIDWE